MCISVQIEIVFCIRQSCDRYSKSACQSCAAGYDSFVIVLAPAGRLYMSWNPQSNSAYYLYCSSVYLLAVSAYDSISLSLRPFMFLTSRVTDLCIILYVLNTSVLNQLPNSCALTGSVFLFCDSITFSGSTRGSPPAPPSTTETFFLSPKEP